MSWINRIASFFTRASQAGGVTVANIVGQAQYQPAGYTASVKRVGRHPVALRCMNLIASSAASVKPTVYIGDDEVPDHPFALLLRKPNQMTGGSQFIEALAGYLKLNGNAFVEATLTGRTPIELYALRPERVRIVFGADGWPSAYEYEANGIKVQYPVNVEGGVMPVLHLRTFNPDSDFFGLGCLEAASAAMDLYLSGRDYQKAVLDNGGRVSGALSYGKDATDKLTKEQVEILRSQVEEQYSGVKSAGKIMVLHGGMAYQQMGLTPQDLQGAKTRDDAAREIALCFGVPPMVLGIPGDNTYSNYQEANTSLWRETILPLVDLIYDGLARWAAVMFNEPELSIRYDMDSIPALAEEVERKWKQAETATHLTIDERRELTGYGPTPGGDVVLVPASTMPLGEDGAATGDEQDAGDPDADPSTSNDPNQRFRIVAR